MKPSIHYFAGFVDGEGCLSFYLQKRKCGDTLTPVITVSNTCKKILNEFSQRFGGSVIKKKDVRSTTRQAYIWRLVGSKAVKVVKVLQPHLRIKQAQAQKILRAIPSTVVGIMKLKRQMHVLNGTVIE